MAFESYRQRLLDKQHELTGAIAQVEPRIAESDDLASQDYGDKANSFNAKESLLQQLSHSRELLKAVEEALPRLEDGTYGRCAECGEEISPKRLDAMPWASLCIGCQALADERKTEQGSSEGGASSRVA